MNKVDLSQAVEFRNIQPNGMFVMWLLGNTCPYKCSYCNSDFNGGDFEFHSLETVQKGLALMPRAHVMFSGGEPKYHPKFEEILATKPDFINASVISNGARHKSFWERVVPELFSIILTFHVEFAFDKLDRFIET